MKLSAEQARSILRSAERVYSAEEVSAAVERLAREITTAVGERDPLVLGVMRGSVMLAGRLLPLLAFPLEFDYLDVTRYAGTQGGAIQWKVSPGTTVAGRVILVLDDILDRGHTLAAIREKLREAGAEAVYSAVFAEKDIGTQKPIAADFVGVHMPNRYLFGFGMDVHGRWRNLPAVYALTEDAFSSAR